VLTEGKDVIIKFVTGWISCVPAKKKEKTCMFLHASHTASTGHQSIIMKFTDTDVAVLARSFSYIIINGHGWNVDDKSV
jgi:hypothetical protein